MEYNKKQAVAGLLVAANKAHHDAFIAVDGDDPEWPIWYAEHLKDTLPAILGRKLTKSRIVFELVRLADSADTGDEHWTQVYAEALVRKYG